MSEQIKSGYVYIYRAYITLKDGTRLDAHQRGKKAFRIAVPVENK